jgi:acetolactate synthase-1/2/3 large subunit
MMNLQELETAVRLGLNLVVLILEDQAYGMISWKQAVASFLTGASPSATPIS